ncbi:hypothetical protein K8R66_01085 [bacterium]|nr:hypothetical protein [bacterium]
MKKVKMMDVKPIIKNKSKSNFSYSLVSLTLILSILVMPYAGYAVSSKELASSVKVTSEAKVKVPTSISQPVVISASRVAPAPANTVDALDDSYSASKNIILEVNISEGVLKNDHSKEVSASIEAERTELIAELITPPTIGTIIDFNKNGSFVYEPEIDFIGEIFFKYKASNKSDSDIAEVVISITNDVPIANADEYEVDVNEYLKKSVLNNDEDLNGDELEAIYLKPLNSKPAPHSEIHAYPVEEKFPIKLRYGILVEFNSKGTFIYEAGSKEGIDTFIYKVNDGSDDSEEVEVVINVKEIIPTPPVNNIPIADAGADQTVDEGVIVTLDGSVSSDADADTLTYLWTAPEGIVLSDSTAVNPTFTAPEVSVNISYTFTLIVNDSKDDSDSDSVIITVNNVVSGCTDASANNYNSEATVDDSSCTYPSSGIPGPSGSCNPSSVSNGTVTSYPSCVITCNTGYVLDSNQCIVDESDIEEEGEVLGEKIYGAYTYEDGTLIRCSNHRIYVIENGNKKYISGLKELADDYYGKEILNVSCDVVASFPEVLGHNTKNNQCIVNFKPQEGDLFRGSNMRIYVWIDGVAKYISSLQELADNYFGVDIINTCD